VRLARAAVRLRPQDFGVRNTLGAVLYRNGDHAAAVEQLNEAVKLNGKGGTPIDFLFLAMAHVRLSHADEARKSLETAVKLNEKEPPVFWTDRLEWQILYREARSQLEVPAGTQGK